MNFPKLEISSDNKSGYTHSKHKQQSPDAHLGDCCYQGYLPILKCPSTAQGSGVSPVDVQVIQRAGVGSLDMLVNPAFVQLTEVGFRKDGTTLGLVHCGAEQVLQIMHRNNHRRAMSEKAQADFLQMQLTAR